MFLRIWCLSECDQDALNYFRSDSAAAVALATTFKQYFSVYTTGFFPSLELVQ